MVLNYVVIGLILLAVVMGCVQALFFGQMDVFTQMLNATFDAAKNGFEISLGLTGGLALWLGIMKIGERGGIVQSVSNGVSPFFRRIFPDIPAKHPAFGSIFMNLAANMLGLDNAATPMGLRAMKEMQELNPQKEKASNPMIMFLVLNTSGLTLIPVSIMIYRAQMGAANPADVFIPLLIATYCSTLVGLLTVCVVQHINIFNRVVLGTLGVLTAVVGAGLYGASRLNQETLTQWSGMLASALLLLIITVFITRGMVRKINVYDAFIEGAKDGFQTAINIIPYLIIILVAVGVFRASGGMELIVDGLARALSCMGWNSDFVPALPVALMKPLSGSGARGLMIDVMAQYGADSFVGRLASLLQGATDTTFYILAVYFGSVGIKDSRSAVACGLVADLAGIIAAILIGYIFFH